MLLGYRLVSCLEVGVRVEGVEVGDDVGVQVVGDEVGVRVVGVLVFFLTIIMFYYVMHY
jgi:hypothetical protein